MCSIDFDTQTAVNASSNKHNSRFLQFNGWHKSPMTKYNNWKIEKKKTKIFSRNCIFIYLSDHESIVSFCKLVYSVQYLCRTILQEKKKKKNDICWLYSIIITEFLLKIIYLINEFKIQVNFFLFRNCHIGKYR